MARKIVSPRWIRILSGIVDRILFSTPAFSISNHVLAEKGEGDEVVQIIIEEKVGKDKDGKDRVGIALCTGIVFQRRCLMTNHHCLFRDEDGRPHGGTFFLRHLSLGRRYEVDAETVRTLPGLIARKVFVDLAHYQCDRFNLPKLIEFHRFKWFGNLIGATKTLQQNPFLIL